MRVEWPVMSQHFIPVFNCPSVGSEGMGMTDGQFLM